MHRTKASVQADWELSQQRYRRGIPASFALPKMREIMSRERSRKPLNYYFAGIYREWQVELSHGGMTRRPQADGEPVAVKDLLRLWTRTTTPGGHDDASDSVV